MRLPIRVPPLEGQRFDVVGFGLNSMDLIAVVAEHPTPNSKQRLQRFAQLPGGQIATAMVTCARLGWRTSYLGSFGDDEFGRLGRESLEREGVDVSASRTVIGTPNQFAVILVDARSGDRTVLWDRPPELSVDPTHISRDATTSGRMLIVDCQETAASAQAARYARAAGIPTIIDVERVRPGIGDLLLQIDAIIAAEAFPSALTGYDDLGKAIQAIAREFDAAVVCVTLGSEGSLAWSNGREIRTPAFSIDCVDSTGAGDAFRGAFAAACLRAPDGTLEEALIYANAVSALNCRALGARGGLPTAAELDEFMLTRY